MRKNSETKPSTDLRTLLPLLLLLFAALALFNFTRFVTNELAEGKAVNYLHYFIMEMTGAFTMLPLILLLIPFIQRYPVQRPHVFPRLLLHGAASLLFGFSHTMLMWGSRNLIFHLLDKGPYDYGLLHYRVPMEYSHQIIIYFITYGIVLYIDKSNRLKEESLRAARTERRLAETRLQTLQRQLQPHFLFNTLNVISARMFDDPDAADRMISDLSELLRRTLNRDGRTEHPLAEEIELLNLYMDIQARRHAGHLRWNADAAPGTEGALVPVFLLQPLVENAIRHGFERNTDLAVGLAARRTGDSLEVIIEDDGPGIQGDTQDAFGKGIGLSNTAQRLAELYSDKQRLHLENKPEGGLRVIIALPFRTGADGERESTV